MLSKFYLSEYAILDILFVVVYEALQVHFASAFFTQKSYNKFRIPKMILTFILSSVLESVEGDDVDERTHDVVIVLGNRFWN